MRIEDPEEITSWIENKTSDSATLADLLGDALEVETEISNSNQADIDDSQIEFVFKIRRSGSKC